jgi:hypothetical protein
MHRNDTTSNPKLLLDVRYMQGILITSARLVNLHLLPFESLFLLVSPPTMTTGAAVSFGMVAPHLLHCCCLLLFVPNIVVQSFFSIIACHHPFHHPSPAAVLLLLLLAPACFHRSHQYLVVVSSARSIVHPPFRRLPLAFAIARRCLPLTFAIARRAIVNSFVAGRRPLLLSIASCCHFALSSSRHLPLPIH